MLKSLELFGFKSFAEKTKFDFSPGITAVVGPNGSGKSNVVDGIKWILGDQSPKSLRGKEMTDVIFNGASGRKGSNFAEATLTFDNTSGFLPSDATEVSIGRRLWRSGDAEYLINRAPARLKDIRDLLMGTGAGSAAYNIIEQGRVDQILQGNASSRRAIFEEAAGISKFKVRKADALRKLERVDQNLLRLTDIVDEVESRLNSLRSQASRAAKYRDISQELKQVWWGLAADDFRYKSRELTVLDKEVAECTAALEVVNARHHELEAKLSTLDEQIGVVEDELRTVEKAGAGHREQLAGHDSTIGHQFLRHDELDIEITRLLKQRTMMALRAGEVHQEREHVAAQLVEFETQTVARRTQLEQHVAEIATVSETLQTQRNAVDEYREQLLEQMRLGTSLTSRVDGLRSRLQVTSESRERVSHKQVELAVAVEDAQAEVDRQRDELEAAGEHVVRLGDRVQQIHAERRHLVEQRHDFQRRLTELREQRSGWHARLAVLEDLEQRQHGLGIGVKEILHRAATSPLPPWNQIVGSVADLLEVELEHAAILEAALGSRAQYIVVRDLQAVVDYLMTGVTPITGRVGFVECADGEATHVVTVNSTTGVDGDLQYEQARTVDLQGQPGVCCRADQLARTSELAVNLPTILLGDTWIVETLTDARRIAEDVGHNVRLVTLQGEVLDARGQIVVGTLQTDTALISRRSELQRLKYQLHDVDAKIAAEEQQLTAMATSLVSFDEELDLIDAELQAAADVHGQLRSDFQAASLEVSRHVRDYAAADNELEKLTHEETQLAADLAKFEAEHAAAEEQLESLQNDIGQREFEVARLEHRLQTLETARTDARLNVAKHEERLKGFKTAAARLEQDERLRLQQQSEVERRYATAVEKRREITLHILNTEAELADLAVAVEEIARQSHGMLKEKVRLRGQRAILLKEETALRKERRELNDQQHIQEMAARDIRHQLESQAEKIREEYQTELSEIVETGCSAYEDYLDEHHPHWRTVCENTVPGEEKADDAEFVDAADVEVVDEIDADEEQDADTDDFDDEEFTDEEFTDEEFTDEEFTDEEFTDEETAGERFRDEFPDFDDVRDEIDKHVNRLRRKLKSMGAVDTESLGDLEEMESRHQHMSTQLQDLIEAKSSLEDVIRRINTESKRLFVETFDLVRGHFQHLFRKAFGGGDGDIVLEDLNDVLECGIEIVARPPGKDLKSISLMSGGEKALTAFALLLALFKTRPSPYCLLDEVDAPLDEANVGRLGALLEEFKGSTQFIVITHKKPTMTIADVLYGVTMEQSGVSKRMSVRFDDVNEHGEFTVSEDAADSAAAA